jgi:acetyl/propionyl-CoA carboxylase alpha subunit
VEGDDRRHPLDDELVEGPPGPLQRLLAVAAGHHELGEHGVECPGDDVTDRYDPLLAKLVVHGRTRAQAIERLREALEQTTVLGVRTNLRFLRWLLAQPLMAEGEMRTDTLSRIRLPDPPELDDEAWSAAAATLVDASNDPWGGGWRLNEAPRLRLRHGDEERSVPIARGGGGIAAADPDRRHAFVDVDGQSVEFAVASAPDVDEAAREASAGGEGRATLTAPMPGRVIAVRVAEGASVAESEPVVLIEAMKMEHAVVSPLAGRVTRLVAREGAQVERGALLAGVEA